MTVREFLKKHNLKMVADVVGIYVKELNNEIYKPYEMERYLDEEVVNTYRHNGLCLTVERKH